MSKIHLFTPGCAVPLISALATIDVTQRDEDCRTFAPSHLGGLQLALVNGDEWTARILLVELNLVADADTSEELLPCILLARQMGRVSEASSVPYAARPF